MNVLSDMFHLIWERPAIWFEVKIVIKICSVVRARVCMKVEKRKKWEEEKKNKLKRERSANKNKKW